MTQATLKDRAINLARRRGIARTRDFDAAGIPRIYLRRLEEEGILVRPSRGLYQLADAEFSASHSLAETAQAVPKGVIALLSALQFHGLTTQTPHEVWVLLPSNAWIPKNPPASLKVIRASGESLIAGVKRHKLDGASVPITVPAKTIADCFKYRSKVGLDIALEALRDALRKRKATADDIWRFAKIDRVARVMRPYLESIQ